MTKQLIINPSDYLTNKQPLPTVADYSSDTSKINTTNQKNSSKSDGSTPSSYGLTSQDSYEIGDIQYTLV